MPEGTLYPLLRRLESQGLLGEPMADRREPPPSLLPDLSPRAGSPGGHEPGVEIAGGGAGRGFYPREVKEKEMNLIDRYIEEVGRFLPRKTRSDVQRELRSTLEDSLESRLANGGDDDAETAQVALLTELGHPEELAASYLPEPRYLIGPRLYPGFQLTMRICLLVAGRPSCCSESWPQRVTTMDQGRVIVAVAVALFDDYLATALTILGIVVFIFAVIERFSRPSGSSRAWDPRSLPEIDDSDRVGRIGQGVKLAFLGLALVVVNFFPDRIGSFVTIGEQSGWVPLLGTAFNQHLWLLNLALGLDLFLNLVVWRRRTLAAENQMARLRHDTHLGLLSLPADHRTFDHRARRRVDDRSRLVERGRCELRPAGRRAPLRPGRDRPANRSLRGVVGGCHPIRSAGQDDLATDFLAARGRLRFSVIIVEMAKEVSS